MTTFKHTLWPASAKHDDLIRKNNQISDIIDPALMLEVLHITLHPDAKLQTSNVEVPNSCTWMVQERNIMSWPSVPRFGMYSRMILHHAQSTFIGMHRGPTGYPLTKLPHASYHTHFRSHSSPKSSTSNRSLCVWHTARSSKRLFCHRAEAAVRVQGRACSGSSA